MHKNNQVISVVLPTYNEAGNIVGLVKRIGRNLSNYLYEIIIVDDNSPDDTAEIVKKYLGMNKRIRLFVKTKDKGLAKAIRYGIEKSRGSFILVMDTDFNHDPDDILKMIPFIEEYDLIIGSRYIAGGGMENRSRFLLSYLYNLFLKIILNHKVHDNLSGFFLINKDSLNKFDYDKIFYGYGDYFIRLIHAAQKKNLQIMEIPVYYKNRTYGESKSKFLSMLVDYSKTVLEIFFQS